METRKLALLNLLIVCINFTWILYIDSKALFGNSLYRMFSLYPTHLTPAEFTFKIWLMVGFSMMFVSWLMYRETGGQQRNPRMIMKVKKIDYLLILNQLFCGMSMVMKLNEYHIVSVFFSVLCLITLLIINQRLEIHKLTSNSFTKYFIRLSFGLYTGWLLCVFAFNFVTIFVKNGVIESELEQYTIDLGVICLTFAFAMYYSVIKLLPTVSMSFSWGLFGILYQNWKQPAYDNYPILVPLIVLFALGLLASGYIFYRCNIKRVPQKVMEPQNSTSIP